jgi:hypothetical protein
VRLHASGPTYWQATGWFTVAADATLLAVGETWQFVGHHGWPVWLLIVVMLTAAVLNTAVRMISDQHTRHPVGVDPAPTAEQR